MIERRTRLWSTAPPEGVPGPESRSGDGDESAEDHTRQFLVAFFDALEGSALPYAVMRNFAGLPEARSGNDIDVMIRPADGPRHRALLEGVARRLAWRLVAAVEKPNIATYRLISPVDDASAWPDVLMFDFFPGDAWYGARFVEAEEPLERRERSGKIHCLSLVDRVLCLVLHHLLCTGNLGKEKYREEITTVLAEHRGTFASALRGSVGERLSTLLLQRLEAVVEGRLPPEMPDLQGALRRAVTWRQLRRRPWGSTRDWARLAFFEARRHVRPPGLIVAVWAEAGSAVSSRVIEEVLEWLWRLDRRNHALLAGPPHRLLTSSHKAAARRVRRWYGVPLPSAAIRGSARVGRQLNHSSALGLVVLLEDDACDAESRWYARHGVKPDLHILLADRQTSLAVAEKRLRADLTARPFVELSGDARSARVAQAIAAALAKPPRSRRW